MTSLGAPQSLLAVSSSILVTKTFCVFSNSTTGQNTSSHAETGTEKYRAYIENIEINFNYILVLVQNDSKTLQQK